jgi:flagellar biosynthesis protein FliR
MLSVTAFQLHSYLAAFLWPFVRILALMTTGPVFGNRAIPVRIKIGLAFLITVVVAPLLGPLPAVDPGSPAGLLILAEQVVIGLAMGLAMQVIFVAIQMAGILMGLQMGIGFASFLDPVHGDPVPVVGEFLSLVATLLFFAVNGHLMVIGALADSFHTLPIGAAFGSLSARTLVAWGAQIFIYGVQISLPVVMALLIINLAIGIISRAAPQLNLFAIGFPITLAAGFAFLALGLPYFLPLMEHLFGIGLQFLPVLLHPGGH